MNSKENKQPYYNERVKKYYRYILYIMDMTDFKLPQDVEDPLPQLKKLYNGEGDVAVSKRLASHYLNYFRLNWKELTAMERAFVLMARLAVACQFSNDEELTKQIDSVETGYYNNGGPVDKLFADFE